MPWLRIDDTFDRHPKVTALPHRERWIWIGILCYCARYETDGYLPENLPELVVGATPKLLQKCLELALLDDLQTGLRVHDWDKYAPKDKTGAERQAAWRKRHGRNGHVTQPVTNETVTEPSTSRAGTARVPDPSRPVLPEPEPELHYDGPGAGNEENGIEDLGPHARALLDRLQSASERETP